MFDQTPPTVVEEVGTQPLVLEVVVTLCYILAAEEERAAEVADRPTIRDRIEGAFLVEGAMQMAADDQLAKMQRLGQPFYKNKQKSKTVVIAQLQSISF